MGMKRAAIFGFDWQHNDTQQMMVDDIPTAPTGENNAIRSLQLCNYVRTLYETYL